LLLHPEKRTKNGIILKASPGRVRIATSCRIFQRDRRPRLVSLAWRTKTLYLITLSADCAEIITLEQLSADRRLPRRILRSSMQLSSERIQSDCSHSSPLPLKTQYTPIFETQESEALSFLQIHHPAFASVAARLVFKHET
jgi:hypothetical protein